MPVLESALHEICTAHLRMVVFPLSVLRNLQHPYAPREPRQWLVSTEGKRSISLMG